jgi:predicted TIM-barrel fold metal-dependent hydrolase
MEAPPALRDQDVAAYVAALGLPGIVDLHVHFMPERVQAKVWAHFDRLDPPWPITYRAGEAERLAILAGLGVRHHTALAYAHRPGMAAWLNRHTLALAAAHPAVVGSFTFYPEPGVEAEVERALTAGGTVAKVHLQVGKFHALDPLLGLVWAELARRRVPVVLHAGAVPDGSGGEEFCGAGKVAGLLDRFPDLVLVVAHLGAPDFGDFLDLAEAAPTLLLDTAMVFGGPPAIGAFPAELVERLGELGGRVLFGSDFPSVAWPFAGQVGGLAALGLGDEWLRAALWRNGARLLGLDAADAGQEG